MGQFLCACDDGSFDPSYSYYPLVHIVTVLHEHYYPLFPHLNPEQKSSVSLLQLLLAALQLSRMLLLFLQPLNVLHRGLEDGPFVPAHITAREQKG